MEIQYTQFKVKGGYVRKVCVCVYDLTADCVSGRNGAGGGSLEVMTCIWGDFRRD